MQVGRTVITFELKQNEQSAIKVLDDKILKSTLKQLEQSKK